MDEISDEQLMRYARHVVLEEVGEEGQIKLLESRVLVIGAGGLGSPVLMYLAAAGVGSVLPSVFLSSLGTTTAATKVGSFGAATPTDEAAPEAGAALSAAASTPQASTSSSDGAAPAVAQLVRSLSDLMLARAATMHERAAVRWLDKLCE